MIRHPGDLVRLFCGLTVLAITSLIAATRRVPRLEEDTFRLINRLPEFLHLPFSVLMQAGSLASLPVVVVVLVLLGRFRLAGIATAAQWIAWSGAKLVKSMVGRQRPFQALEDVFRHTTDSGLGFPSGHATIAAVLATVLGPHFNRLTRRALWGLAILVGIARVFVGAHLPLDVVGGWMLGWCIGSVINLVTGTPASVPALDRLESALGEILDSPVTVKPLFADARGSTPYIASGGPVPVFAKVVTSENRDADTLFKIVRKILYRRVEDEAPFVSPQQVIEHEAYSTLMADRAGVRVARILGTGRFDKWAVLASELIDGSRSLDGVDEAEIRQLLPGLWQQVRALHDVRIAHRDLRLANLMVDTDNDVWLIDFGFAQVAATDRLLALDTAELLVETALVVGTDAAVNSVLSAIDHQELTRVLPLLQPQALSGSTRTALRHNRKLLAELRVSLANALGVDEPHLEPLLRIRPRNVITLAVLGVAVHLLASKFGDLDQTFRAVRHGRWQWVVAALAFSAITYVFAAVSLRGASPVRLPLGEAVTAQLASSFGNRFVPMGGLGVLVRYMQRHGLDSTAATTTIATVNLGGITTHVPLLLIFGIATGTSDIHDIHLPSGWHLLVIATVLLALLGVALATPLRHKVATVVHSSFRQAREVLSSPARAAQLWGGSVGLNLGYIAALACSLHAFSAGTPLIHVAFVYLAGSAAASAAPTPGGLGAMEAALVAGLTATGTATAPALAGVLTFRLVTFWIPTLPAWGAFTWLHRRGEL